MNEILNFSLNSAPGWLGSSLDGIHPRIFTEEVDSLHGQYLLATPASITVSPAAASAIVGSTRTFNATPKDRFNITIIAVVMWSSNNITIGTINISSGVYTAVSAGTATITATRETVSGTVSGTATATVVIPGMGDINGDNIVDYKDLGQLGASYGLSLGDAGYNPNTDLNKDGTVDYKDLGILGAHYGEQT